jgi:prepilin-type N-terminal cleavage/methylation domain-containing protein
VFSSRRCAGFTLVELLVATTLFSVGVLALAGTSLAIARLERWSARDARAAATVESRLELLRARPCTPRSARDSARDITELWAALAPSDGVALLFDSVTIAGDAGWAARTEAFRSTTPCN